ncbi:uncharacterized protein LOC9644904 [Selaginella moellendorffii]|uniref:uncharacterized protein LOC9644904 n=1 Tax=Selaginella moellendorffii TaxID=88036 RepID=UPI000D1CDB09|nr:uncharacterized protein LOC9644904 [Selaginella moellendorffii]|eukprot:XP_024545062.1 uncharacterized protein LOC9644904 [Selaginella moellendorffii]
MVLGIGKKKGIPVGLVYNIALHDVKPWPSVTLPPMVLIQWQRGEKRTGHTKCVSGDKDKIILNDSLTIPATLYKFPEKKHESPRFQKKCIVFSLCEAAEQGIPRGQPLGRAVLDLADYGNLNDQNRNAISSIPVAVARKEFSSLGTPRLSFTIAPQGITSSSSVPPVPLTEDKEEYSSLIASLVSDEEDDITAFTDEDEDEVEDAEEGSSQLSSRSVPLNPPTIPPDPEAMPSSTRNDRVQRILNSAGASSSFSSSSSSSFVAAAVAASAYASQRKPSFNSASPRRNNDVEQKSKLLKTKASGASNVIQAARIKYAEGAGERSERLDKKAVEEARQRADAAEAKAIAVQQEAKQLMDEVGNLKWELQEAAALELALYSAVAQHGSSSHKIHAPARRLARIYVHACNKSSQRTRASTARTCASGLVVVVRACENDVSRLTFWWSNVAVLREMISHAFDTAPPSLPETASDSAFHDWHEKSTLASMLERIEAWIFGRIVECIWWQSLTPHMQSSAVDQSSVLSTPRSVVSRLKKSVRDFVVTPFEDSHQGMLSIEIWKAAFLDALQRICPVRAGGHDCGCLQVVERMIVEQCVARLDVAMFNAILRDMEENVPTDPISDPITDLSVLPIPPDGISFGGGAQLKNVINTWSTWLLALTAHVGEEAAAAANIEKGTSHFTMLRAMSDLLMLPKDMLMEKSIRKEVCPALSLLLIRRVLSKFAPDEYAPDPIPPSLLAALNAEISMERQRVGESDISPGTIIMASAPPVVYFPPSSACMGDIVDMKMMASSTQTRSASLFRKGHTSDEELEELESPLFLLVENGCIDGKEAAYLSGKDAFAQRYRLLRKVWNRTES